MKLGEYIKTLLKNKSVRVSELAKELGLSSRNEIYRLFRGENSYEKQKRLIDDIVDHVSFTDDEIDTIYALLNDFKSGKFADDCKSILLKIYEPSDGGYIIHSGNERIRLTDMLNRHGGRKTIIMSGVSSERFLRDVKSCMNEETKIYHYLRLAQNDTLTAYEILALIMLSEFEGYVPIEDEKWFVDVMLVLSADGGRYYMQELDLSKEGTLFESEITEDLYNHILDKNRRIEERSHEIKQKDGSVRGYVEVFARTLNIDKGDTFYSEGAPCFGYLPFEIIADMFEGINYFGFPKDHEYVKMLTELMLNRSYLLHESGHKRFVFDTKSVEKMMLTGMTVDHAKEFPPLTVKQRQEYFKALIEYLSENKDSDKNGYRCRFLKNNRTVNLNYVYSRDRMLHIYRMSNSDTASGGEVIMYRNKSVDETMRYFTEYVWDHLTLSDDETIEILKDMAKRYLRLR